VVWPENASDADPFDDPIAGRLVQQAVDAVGVPVVLRAVSWTDTNTGGSSHTYRVTATSANLAESPYAGPVTG